MSIKQPARENDAEAAVNGTANGASITADQAWAVASDYLLDHVGDLLEPGLPRLEKGRWVMTIHLSNAQQGDVGEAGVISVDASTGELLVTQDTPAEIKACARS